jgi:cytochrome c oxidase subunit III
MTVSSGTRTDEQARSGPRADETTRDVPTSARAGTTARAVDLSVAATGLASTSRWGMIAFLLTEATLFGALFSAYFYLRFNNSQWPLGGIEPPELLLPGIMTVALILSSVFMAFAESATRKDRQGQLRLGLAIAWLLSAAFLVMQGIEYSREVFSPQTNAYGSIFFMITGLHGTHVFVGLLIALYTQARAWLGHFHARRSVAVSNTALYWHFVDGIWLIVFTVLYLYPHVLG